MDPTHYQGLFYLSLGVGSFICLLLGLRIIADELAKKSGGAQKHPTSAWAGREELEIVEVIEETHDVKTFRLRRLDARALPAFAPGQFISLQIGDDAKTLRSYSLSNDAYQRDLVQISIKRLTDGKGSGWFHSLVPGKRVWAYPPSGLFTDQDLGDAERVYIAGGIGITPMLSMISTHLAKGAGPPMTLLYGMRTSDDMAFHAFLSYLSTRHRQLRYVPFLSTGSPGWLGATGFITFEAIKAKLGDALGQAHFFLCGPEPMTSGLMTEMAHHGIADERIHFERFASPLAFDREAVPERKAQIQWEGRSYPYAGRDTILEFLESRGIDLPFACRVGVCGTCKCRVKGKVSAITDAGLTAAEKRLGMTLPCVAFPLEDIELELG